MGASPHDVSPFSRLALAHSRGILRIPKKSERANPKSELLSSSLLIQCLVFFLCAKQITDPSPRSVTERAPQGHAYKDVSKLDHSGGTWPTSLRDR